MWARKTGQGGRKLGRKKWTHLTEGKKEAEQDQTSKTKDLEDKKRRKGESKEVAGKEMSDRRQQGLSISCAFPYFPSLVL